MSVDILRAKKPGQAGKGFAELSPEAVCACAAVHEDRVAAARESAVEPAALGDLGELFKVFSDPTRLRILRALSASELCVCDIGAALGMSQSAVSHQLAVLRAARLVRGRREGKVVFYSLDDEHVGAILAVGLGHVTERRARS